MEEGCGLTSALGDTETIESFGRENTSFVMTNLGECASVYQVELCEKVI